MPRAVFIIPPAFGHFNPTVPIARQLQQRNFSVEYLTNVDFEAEILRKGFSFVAHPESTIRRGDSTEFFDKQSRRVGLDVLRGVVQQLTKILPPIIESTLELFSAKKPSIVITDDYRSVVGAVVAQVLNIPWATVIVTPIRQPDDLVPPAGSGLTLSHTIVGRMRKMVTQLYFRRILAPLVNTHLELSRRYALNTRVVRNYWLSPDLTLSLTTPEFEFPRRTEIMGLRFVGPCIDFQQPLHTFGPLIQARGKRLAFISLGTINNNHPKFFHAAIQGCLTVDPEMHVIASAGNRIPANEFDKYPANVTVVPFAPQLEILENASIMITHGGMNSVSEAMFFGVPLVVFPVGADQPDVAARVEHCGAGVRGDIKRHDSQYIAGLVARVFGQPSFAKNALRMRDAYRAAGGARKAAELLAELSGKTRDLQVHGPSLLDA